MRFYPFIVTFNFAEHPRNGLGPVLNYTGTLFNVPKGFFINLQIFVAEHYNSERPHQKGLQEPLKNPQRSLSDIKTLTIQ